MWRRPGFGIVLLTPVFLLLVGALATWAIAGWIESRYPPMGRFLEVSGGRLHYLDTAPAQPLATVVLLHGASSTLADSMLSLGTRLGERYRVIAFDRPGHGWSDRLGGGEAALPARQAASIAEALRKLGVAKAVIVAHSWAGSLAPNLAL